jgi:hypothetical protein
MINALIGNLAATARSAGLAARQTAAQTGRRIAAIAIVAVIAAAALIGALAFVTAAIHREIALAASPTVADLVLAGVLLVVAVVTIAILANLGRINQPPSHGAAGPAWQRPPAAPFAATGSGASPPPPPPPPQPPPSMADLLAGVDKSWIFGAVAAAFIIGIGLGRRR